MRRKMKPHSNGLKMQLVTRRQGSLFWASQQVTPALAFLEIEDILLNLLKRNIPSW